MADYKAQLISDVTTSLADRMSPEEIGTVSEEMTVALRDYEVTRLSTELATYEGINESIIKRYRACMIIAGKSPKTVAAYERTAKKLFEALRKNYTDMSVSDLRYFIAYEKSRGISNRTLENTRAQLSAFFAWLLDEELIYKNPCRTIKPIKYTDEVRHPFSNVEIDTLRTACKTKKERAIIEVLLASGVRVSELCSLKLSDINFETLAVTVREGKGSKQRTVFITDLASKHLVEYLTTRNVNGEYLFYNKWRKPLNAGGIRHILNQIADRAGVDNVHPHRFRRTFATGMANRGMDIQDIGRLLGHANLNTTLTYVYSSEDKIRTSYLKYSA